MKSLKRVPTAPRFSIWILRACILASLVLSLAPQVVEAGSGTVSGSNSADVTYTEAYHEVYSGIYISGAPAGATIESVEVHWNVDSNYITDIDYYVDSSTGYRSSWYNMYQTGDDWLDGYSQTSDDRRTFYPPSTTGINGWWWFNIMDAYDDYDPNWNLGRIDSWDITITYNIRETLVVVVNNASVNTGGSTTVYGELDGVSEDPNGKRVYGYLDVRGTSYYLGYNDTHLDLVHGGNGVFALPITSSLSSLLCEGDYTISAEFLGDDDWYPADGTGTLSANDTLDPSSPGTPDMYYGDDSGQSSSDNVTNDSSIRFDWSAASDGPCSIAKYYYAVDDSSPESDGYVAYSPYALGVYATEGTHYFYVKAEDYGGNPGPYSRLQFTIDRTGPSTPGTPDMASYDDSGTLSTDNVTNDTSIRFDWSPSSDSLSGVAGYWWALDDSTPESGGSWTPVPYVTGVNPSEGTHYLYVKAADEAGNLSSYYSRLLFAIDRTAPSTPGTPDMDSYDDSGSSSTDNLTNDSSIRFDWSASSDNMSGVAGYWWALDDSTPNSDGTWTLNPYCTGVNPNEGGHGIYVRSQDHAGNLSSAVSSLSFSIDRTPPLPPTFVDPEENESTDDATPLLDWQDISNVWLYQTRVYDDVASPADTRTSPEISASQWEVLPELAPHTWNWQVRARDIAGNLGSYGRNGVIDAWGHFAVTTPYAKVQGHVTSRRWPYFGVEGATVTSDSGEQATTNSEGYYEIPNVPKGTRTLTASRPDYWATDYQASESKVVSVYGDTTVDFSDFAGKATALASISVDKDNVAPGESFLVTVTLDNENYAVNPSNSWLDLSFDDSRVTVGTPTGSDWTSLTSYPPGSSGVWGVHSDGTPYELENPPEYLISANREGWFHPDNSYSFTVPLRVRDYPDPGSITLKYRGTILDDRDPDSTGSAGAYPLDQQGWNVKTLEIPIVYNVGIYVSDEQIAPDQWASGAYVKIYSSDWSELLAEGVTADPPSYRMVPDARLPWGTFPYELFNHQSIDSTREYWGTGALTVEGTMAETLPRSSPFVWEVRVLDSNGQDKLTPACPGENLTIRVEAKSPDEAVTSRQTRVTLYLNPDQSLTDPAGIQEYAIPSGSGTAYAFDFPYQVPAGASVGSTYYANPVVEGWYNGHYEYTDRDNWSGSFDIGECATPPTVIYHSPTGSDVPVDVPANWIVAEFDQDMNGATINTNTFLLETLFGAPVTGAVSYDAPARMATFDPTGVLQYGTTYRATITGGTDGVKSVDGTPMEGDHSWTFITQEVPSRLLSVPYYHQGLNSWCAPTSLAMYLRYYGKDATPWQIASDWALGPREGPSSSGFVAMVEAYLANRPDTTDLTLIDWGAVGILNFDHYRIWLDESIPVYVAASPADGFFTTPHGGHASVVVGYTIEDDIKYLYIHDPSGAWTDDEWSLGDETAFVKVPWDEFFDTFNNWLNIGFRMQVFVIGAPYQSNYPSATLFVSNPMRSGEAAISSLDDTTLLPGLDLRLGNQNSFETFAYRYVDSDARHRSVELDPRDGLRVTAHVAANVPWAQDLQVNLEIKNSSEDTVYSAVEPLAGFVGRLFDTGAASFEEVTLEVPSSETEQWQDGDYSVRLGLWPLDPVYGSDTPYAIIGPFGLRLASQGRYRLSSSVFDGVALDGYGDDESDPDYEGVMWSQPQDVEADYYAYVYDLGDLEWGWRLYADARLDFYPSAAKWKGDTGTTSLEFRVEVRDSNGDVLSDWSPWQSTDMDGDAAYGDSSDRGGTNPFVEAAPLQGPLPDLAVFWIQWRLGESVLSAPSKVFAVSSEPCDIVLNEVFTESYPWIELYNRGDTECDLTGLHLYFYSRLNDSDPVNEDYVFPDFSLQPHAYVVVHDSMGTDTGSDLYTGGSWVIWPLDDSSGAVLLTDGTLGHDFMRWGSSGVLPDGTGWTGYSPTSPQSGMTLGRDSISTDTDDGNDWMEQSPSMGSQNSGALPTCYTLTPTRTGNGADPVAYPANSPACPLGQYVAGELIDLTASPDPGWHVAGWSGTDDDASTSTANQLTMPDSDHTVTVLYEEDAPPCYSLTLTATGNGADPVAYPANSPACPLGQYVAGELIDLTASPDPGWHVAGWSGTDDDASPSIINQLTMPANDHTVTVHYEEDAPPCYTLTPTRTGSGDIPITYPTNSSACPLGQYVVGELISLTATPDPGWYVASWSGTDNDASQSTANQLTMPASDHIVTVHYEEDAPPCYSLALTATGNGDDPVASPTNSAACPTGQYVAGELIDLTANPDPGWYVAGWSGTDNDASQSTANQLTMPASDHTVIVHYEEDAPPCYVLTLTATGNGADPVANPANSAACPTGQYVAGELIDLTASPDPGWHVAGWTGTDNDASTSTANQLTMPASDHTVTVHYEEDAPPCYSLTLTATGNGDDPVAYPANSSACPIGQYVAGELIDLTADPDAGWHVAGWSGTDDDASTSTTNQLTMPASDHTVTVHYEEDAPPCYALILSATGSGADPVAYPTNSSACPLGQYVAGELIDLTASPDSGWHVSGWTGTDDDSSTSTINQLTMPASDHNVTVHYEEDAPPCYSLTLTATGSGDDPVASPVNSSACPLGQYVAGELIDLAASPDLGWHVAGWSGTDDDASTSTANQLTMPASDHTATVHYEEDEPATGDSYEPDNSWDLANWIEDGVSQTHSIEPVGDEDWVKFSLDAESAIVLETSGRAYDTRMWLYDSSLNELEYDDDDGLGLFASIDRVCGVDALPPGTYYVKIDDFRSDSEISAYDIEFAIVQPCGGEVGPLVYDSHFIDDDSLTSSGDNDGIVDCGETIELNVTLKNQGTLVATDVVAALATTDSYVSITDDQEDFPDIAGGGTAEDVEDYDFVVDPATPHGHIIRFDLNISASNGGPWSDTFDVSVSCGGNNPPYEPVDPTPGNGSTDIPITTDLSWTGGDPDPDDLVTYDVYFGTTSPPTVLLCDDVTATTCDPGTLSYNTPYYWYVVATDSHGSSTTGLLWDFTTSTTASGDSYEPDDTWDLANWIEDSVPQTHSIDPVGDVDWVWFSLDEESEIVLETSDARRNTRMWLYDSELNEIDYDDDSGMSALSRIDRICGVDALPAGTYYVKIDEDGGDNDIPSYNITFTLVRPCVNDVGPLVYDSHFIDDDGITSDGDDDGIVDCGETIELDLVLRNEGTETATDVVAQLSTSDSYISITDDQENFRDIAAGTTGQSAVDYDFVVDTATPDGHIIHFDLDITASNGGPWSDTFDVYVSCGGNNPPYEPSGPKPADGAVEVSVATNLSWTGGDPDMLDTVIYDVFFGTTNPPTELRCDDLFSTSCDLGTLSAYTSYYWYVIATDSQDASTTGPVWSFTTGTAAGGDPYEPDDTWDLANWIEDGVAQTHSIEPVGDQDWVKFTLDVESEITLETYGAASDTTMWLYDSDLTELEYDDDDGWGRFSYIDRVCGEDALPAGTYYVNIDEYRSNDEIASYDLTFTVVQSCAGDAGPLEYDNHTIDDDTLTSNGDNDGIVDCGETIELNIILRNQGSGIATDVVADLSTTDPYISITDAQEDFSDIAGGGTGEDVEDYDFVVDPATPDGHIIHLDLDIAASNGGPWTDSFDVPVACSATIPGWSGVGSGSASDGGISDNSGSSTAPSIALASDGTAYMAWTDDSSGNSEIYVLSWNGSAWQEIGAGSASGGGISNSTGSSSQASIALAPDDTPYVAWRDNSSGYINVYVRRWEGTSWEEVGTGSATGRGVTNTTDMSISTRNSIAVDANGVPYLIWDEDDGEPEIFVRRWNGVIWEAAGTGADSGGGISNTSAFSYEPVIEISPDNIPYAVWHDDGKFNYDYDIYARRLIGDTWEEIGVGSATGAGIISPPVDGSLFGTVAFAPDGTTYVAWQDESSGDYEVYVRRWNGASWEEVGIGSASSGGVSDNAGHSGSVSLAVAPDGTPYLAWQDESSGDFEVYVRRWNGTAWEEVGTGSATDGGISDNDGSCAGVTIAIDPAGIPYVAWADDSSGDYEIFILRWLE